MLITPLLAAAALQPPPRAWAAPRGRVVLMSDAETPSVDLAARTFFQLAPPKALALANTWLPGDEQAEVFASMSGALAEADASEDPEGRRSLIDALHVSGVGRGPRTALFASVRRERVVVRSHASNPLTPSLCDGRERGRRRVLLYTLSSPPSHL